MNITFPIRVSPQIKIALELFLVFTLCIVMIMVFHFYTHFISDKLNILNRNILPKSNAAAEMQLYLQSHSHEVLEYLNNHNEAQLEKIRKDAASFEYFLKRYHDLASINNEERQLYLEANENYDLYSGITAELLKVESERSEKLENLVQYFSDLEFFIEDKLKTGFSSPVSISKDKTEALQAIGANVRRISYNLLKYINTNDELLLETVFLNSDDLRQNLTWYMEQSMTKDESSWISNLDILIKRQEDLINDIILLHKSKVTRLELFLKIRQILDYIIDTKIENEAQFSLNVARNDISETLKFSKFLFLMLSLFSLVLGIIMFVIINRYLHEHPFRHSSR